MIGQLACSAGLEIGEDLQRFSFQSENDLGSCHLCWPGIEPGCQLDLDEVRLEPVLYVVEASSLLAEVVLLP